MSIISYLHLPPSSYLIYELMLCIFYHHILVSICTKQTSFWFPHAIYDLPEIKYGINITINRNATSATGNMNINVYGGLGALIFPSLVVVCCNTAWPGDGIFARNIIC